MNKPIRIVARLKTKLPPEEGQGVRLAIFQGEGPVGTEEAVETNLSRMAEVVAKARAYAVHVCIFPEKFNTGYAITLDQCHALAETVDGRSVTRARQVAGENKVAVILPYPEVDRSGAEPNYYDSIAVAGPDGSLLANYRKTHLYGAAERRNYSFGNEFPPIVAINGFPTGIINCYECEFPPLYQYLAEKGARLVIGPTAADYHFTLSDGTESQVPYQDATRHIIPAMASVWKLFVCYANRRGWEGVLAGWWQYQGNSGLWAPNGETVIKAGPEEQLDDSLLIADCRPEDHAPFSPEGNHLFDNRLRLVPKLEKGR